MRPTKPRKLLLAAALSLMIVSPLLASPVTAQPEPEPRFRALVFSKVTNFFHQSIPAGKAAITQLGAEHNFAVDVNDDSAVFNDADLARYDVVIFNNTNSTPAAGALLNADQRAAFQRYIEGGGGFVGIHSASGTERDWDWYGGLVGAFFQSHPAIQELTVQVSDRVHPSTQGLPKEWVRTEEPYDFLTNPRGDVHVLASFDETTYDGDTMGFDHPISWCQNYDGGRSWYTGMGHSSSAFTDEPLFLDHILGGIEWAAGAVEGDCGATVDDNFQKVPLVGGDELVDPMELAVAPDGRVFIIERTGAVKVFDPEANQTSTIAQLDVLVAHTHGLNGLTLDPDFATNHWLYLYYSPTDAEEHYLSRFTFDEAAGTLDLSSEKVLLKVPAQREVNAHEAGSMAWDADGNLYLATGDNSLPTQYTPIDEREGQEYVDAQRSSGNTNDLRGKILRIRPTDDGGYTIPDGNLFPPGTAQTRPEIYVMGLRQPYRIHVDSETGALYWGNVGPDAGTSDPARGPLGLDEFNRATGPGNYGWPHCIGPNFAYIDYDFATGESGEPFDCENGPTNDSPNNSGLTRLPPAKDAWIWYPYQQANYPGEVPFPEMGNGGRLAVAGPTYHFDPGLGLESAFPAYYDDKVFIAEWIRGWIKVVTLDDEGNPLTIDPFMGTTEFKRPHDMEFGPDGSLYLIEWGSNYGGAGRGDPNSDSGVYRIDYAKQGFRAPLANAAGTPTDGAVPLTVEFSSEGSSDPDGQSITFAWDFESDGTVDSTEPDPTHTYTVAGNYNAQLTVTDSTGRTGVANVPVAAGNTRPQVRIETPLDGQFFEFGDRIPYRVTVDDAEDGSTATGDIDCSEVIVEPALGHDDHAHPLERQTGCEGVIETITDHGHNADDNMFYVVDAFYADQGAPGVDPLTGGDQVELQPKRLHAENADSRSGVAVFDTGDGGQMIGQIDHGDWIAFDPVNLHETGQVTYRVASDGAGGRIEVRLDAPDGQLLSTAQISPTGGWRTFETVTVPVDDPGGTHELYFVFAKEPGATSLLNLDWIEFGNPVLDPLDDALRATQDLQDETERLTGDGSLSDDQTSYLQDQSSRLVTEIEAARQSYTNGDDGGLSDHSQNALAAAGGIQRWLDNQERDGALAADDAAALAQPLTTAASALSQVVARVAQVTAALEPADPEVVAGEDVELVATVRNDGDDSLRHLDVGVSAPEGWTVEPLGSTGTPSLSPGEEFTTRFEASVPLNEAPDTITVEGEASYGNRGATTVVVPVTADVSILPPVEVTALDAAVPLLGGEANPVAVSVTNNRSTDEVEVSASVDVPEGWSSETVTRTLAPQSSETLEIAVTPPFAPAVGLVEPTALTASVSSPDAPVYGDPSVDGWAAPSGDVAALALDSGTAGSPVSRTYARLAPGDAWDPDVGYGWVDTQADNRDRGGPDVLRRDFTWSGTSQAPGTLRITVPPGSHDAYVLTGDAGFQSSDTVVFADGERVAETGEFLAPGEFKWLQFELDGGPEGRTVDLGFVGEGYEEYWRLNAFVLSP